MWQRHSRHELRLYLPPAIVTCSRLITPTTTHQTTIPFLEFVVSSLSLFLSGPCILSKSPPSSAESVVIYCDGVHPEQTRSLRKVRRKGTVDIKGKDRTDKASQATAKIYRLEAKKTSIANYSG
jgi:hypothetical protein